MREYNVGGSPVKNKLFIQSSLNEGFDFVSINIGIEEVLCALLLLSSYDSEEDL